MDFLLLRHIWLTFTKDLVIKICAYLINFFRVFQEMLYGISTGFGSPQVPVAEILARAAPSPPTAPKPKSSNFLQVPDIEGPRWVLQSCPKIMVLLVKFHVCLNLDLNLSECFLLMRFYVKSIFAKSQSQTLSFLTWFWQIWALFQGRNHA